MNGTTTYEITGNQKIGFYVWRELGFYGNRAFSGSYLSDSAGKRKRFDTPEEAQQAIAEDKAS